MSPGGTSRLLVLMAHPDDEFAIYPWIAEALRNGMSLYCAWLTDGGWGGQDPRCREEESRAVLSGMGVENDKMLFLGTSLGLADGDLQRRMDALPRILEAVRDTCGSGEIWCPAWEGGHPDHDAAFLIAQYLARELGTEVFQFPLYHGKGLPGPLFRVMSPLVANGTPWIVAPGWIERARCILRCLSYRSQWKSFAGLLPFYVLRLLGRHPFALQPASLTRALERPHPGPLLYERRNGVTFEAFCDDVAPLLEGLRYRSKIVGV